MSTFVVSEQTKNGIDDKIDPEEVHNIEFVVYIFPSTSNELYLVFWVVKRLVLHIQAASIK